MPDLAVWILVAIAGSVVAGAVVQSVVGLGLGLVAAPVVTLLAPHLMPGSLLVLGMVLPTFTLARERRDLDWHGFGWALPGRLVGTVVGVWVVATVSARDLGVAVGLAVLLAVALTARAITVPVTRTSLGVAGFTSGIAATTSAIGGPPMALLSTSTVPRARCARRSPSPSSSAAGSPSPCSRWAVSCRPSSSSSARSWCRCSCSAPRSASGRGPGSRRPASARSCSR